MRVITFVISLLCCVSIKVSAQQADARVGDMINNEDYFALIEEYPKLKSEMQYPFLQLLAEALIARECNQPETTIAKIEKLLKEHQEELQEQALNLALLRASLFARIGEYAKAADAYKSLMEQLSGHTEIPAYGIAQSGYEFYEPIRDYGKISLSRPGKDVVVPFKPFSPIKRAEEMGIKKGKYISDSKMMKIPVTIHGKQSDFIFDTGAQRTLASRKFAKEANLKIFDDTLSINNTSSCLRAYIDSIQVGDIVCRNLFVYIPISDIVTDSLGVDAVLGLDFMNAVGESRILLDRKEIMFPATFTSMPAWGSNMRYNDENIFFKASKDGKPLDFLLDTGAVGAELSTNCYNKFKAEIDANSVRDTTSSTTIGSTLTQEKLLLSAFTMTTSGKDVTVSPIYVNLDSPSINAKNDGVMGMDLVSRFNSVTINFRDMFVIFE